MKIQYCLPKLLLTTSLLICGCSSEETVEIENVREIYATLNDFKTDNMSTRTEYNISEATGFQTVWATGDVLGIYPIGGDQVSFPISDGAGTTSAKFDGGSWALRGTYKYAAYYPFSKDCYTINQTAIPVSFLGQVQDGNNTTAHLAAVDFMAAAGTQPSTNGSVNFQFNHVGCFLRMQFTMPEPGSFTSLIISADEDSFTTQGTVNLAAATPAIISTSTASSLTLDLNNISTTNANQTITLYMMVAPDNLSGKKLTFTIKDVYGNTYSQTSIGKNMMATYAYNYTLTMETNSSGNNIIYVGDVNIDRANFAYLSTNDLKNNAEKIEFQTLYSGSYESTKPAFFMLIPSQGVSLNNVTYGSAPLVTDILNQNGWNIEHEDISIDGKIYKVYGYYAGMTDNEHRLTYDYEVKVPIMHMGHEYIDLGLKDEYGRTIYWATCNIGAMVPADFGDYFAWGEVETKDIYSEDTYYYQEDISEDISYSQYDVAHVKWGGRWRMPSNSELDLLRYQCTWTWTGRGYKISNRNDSRKNIYLPTTGYRKDSSLFDDYFGGYYWSSTLITHIWSQAFRLYFGLNCIDWYNYEHRYIGQPVRAVCVFEE